MCLRVSHVTQNRLDTSTNNLTRQRTTNYINFKIQLCCLYLHIFIVRKQICGKVMFLHLSLLVILFTAGRCTSPGQTSPWTDTPWQTPPKEMTNAADGTYPTRMHSCFTLRLKGVKFILYFCISILLFKYPVLHAECLFGVK